MRLLKYINRTAAWKLLLLLFWAVFGCAMLFANKGGYISDIARNYFHPASSNRLRRMADNKTHQYDMCTEMKPEKEDFDLLNWTFHEQNLELDEPKVHCSVVSSCDTERPFKAQCFSRQCRIFKVSVMNGNHVIPSLSAEAFSQFVDSRLQENSIVTVEDMNEYMDVHCQEPTQSSVQITGDILSNQRCTKTQRPVSKNEASHTRKTNSINVIYFRFLSQWEIPVRFPGLFSLLKVSADTKDITTIHFTKHQATAWADYETLTLLLQGQTGPFSFNTSLLKSLHDEGYCFRFEDFSCSRSRKQESLITNVTASKSIHCGSASPAHDTVMERLCANGNLSDSETESVVTSLMSDVHDSEERTVNKPPTFSVSIINTKDFHNYEVLDNMLMNIFTSLLGQKNHTVMLVSDVGNPMFLRFDQNARLQSQASNPVLMLASTTDISSKIYNSAKLLQHAPFSMQHVHYFLKALILEEQNMPKINMDFYENFDNEDLKVCARLNVKPPFTCVCKEEFVNYDNDTLMVGFAELAVRVINARLQLVQSGGHRARCATLSGLAFTNVRIGFHNNRKRIIMDIKLENDLYRDKTWRQVWLDIWGTNKTPKSSVHVFKTDLGSSVPLPNTQSNDILKALCQTGERLDDYTSSESGLLKRWSQERHFGRRGKVTHVHDGCLYMFVRDFGDSISVEMANVCRDRHYKVKVHLSLVNMMSLTPLPLSASLGHVQREVMAVIVKVSYTVPTFAYKLHPDFEVFFDP